MVDEDEFTQAMLKAYDLAKEECGYDAKRFRQMVHELKGVETARRLLRSTDNSGGYLTLLEKGRLDLTLECLVLQKPWRGLFTASELAAAKAKLKPEQIPPDLDDPLDHARSQTVELEIIRHASEVAENLRVFVRDAIRHRGRAVQLFNQTSYWIFDPASQSFGPNKFLAFQGMTFEGYELACEGKSEGYKFDGMIGRVAIETALGAAFEMDADLSNRCRTWGEALLGPGSFGGADTSKWRFIRLPLSDSAGLVPGRHYTRRDLYTHLRVPDDKQRGNWDTGYTQYNGEWFVFAGVGTPGRTGHDYNNHWMGDDLYWRGKNGSRSDNPSIKSMLSGAQKVHIFTREDDRTPFVYEGQATPKQVWDLVPVAVLWQFSQGTAASLPEEVVGAERYVEGTVKTIKVNVYERNLAARRKCLEHLGTSCSICGVDLAAFYGPIAEGFIHVHHLTQLASIGKEYQIDPLVDLTPVCPNCHAILHRVDPPMNPQTLKEHIARQRAIANATGPQGTRP